MKILVQLSGTDAFYRMPGSVIRQFILEERDVINRQKKEGKISDVYFEFEGKGPIIIYECNTAEELNKYLNEIPAAGLMNITVKPLANLDEVYNDILENMEKGDDIMPGGAVK